MSEIILINVVGCDKFGLMFEIIGIMVVYGVEILDVG